jgi:hypothetical protein
MKEITLAEFEIHLLLGTMRCFCVLRSMANISLTIISKVSLI